MVGDDARTAAHVSDFRLGTAGLVKLQVKRRVNEGEIRKQAFGRHTAGQFEQIIVRVAFVEIDALLDLEDVDRENRRLAVAKPGLGGAHDAFRGKPPFRRRIGPVID